MLYSIENALEKRNPFALSVDSVLVIAKKYKYFTVSSCLSWLDKPDSFRVVGYKSALGKFFGAEYELLSSESADDCWYMVSVFRNVHDFENIRAHLWIGKPSFTKGGEAP